MHATARSLPHRFASLVTTALLAISVSMLSGCVSQPTLNAREARAQEAASYGFVDASPAGVGINQLYVQLKQRERAETLSIYIEADGATWPNPSRPPADPTPDKPIVFAMALADPTAAVAYIGRPCQYLNAAQLAQCPMEYWAGKRYSADAVQAINTAINALKAKTGARRLRLIGYDGGGVIATLVAIQRKDVGALITVASPINPQHVLNERVPPALHFVGGRDLKVPETIAASFVAVAGGRLSIVDDFDHECCWPSSWAKLQRDLP